MTGIPRRLWPYDEVKATRDAGQSNRFVFSTPWFKIAFNVASAEADRAEALADKVNTGNLGPEDIDEITWMFSAVAKFPMAYILPRPSMFGTDEHKCIAPPMNLASPVTALASLAQGKKPFAEVGRMSKGVLDTGWTWDAAAALEFSRTPYGYDPEALFSVVRRFHLLNDLENNRTADMLAYVRSLKSDEEKFRKASALVLRQNHYVTVQCDSVLKAGLTQAASAKGEVTEFIKAESGHDRLMARALTALGESIESVPAIDSAVVLMEVFRWAGERNLLAFAMITDIFERTSYHEKDPFATMLEEGGQDKASRQVDQHRVINDEGEHENVALGFLQWMKPVDEAYAREALRIAELLTLVVHQVSAETLARLKA